MIMNKYINWLTILLGVYQQNRRKLFLFSPISIEKYFSVIETFLVFGKL